MISRGAVSFNVCDQTCPQSCDVIDAEPMDGAAERRKRSSLVLNRVVCGWLAGRTLGSCPMEDTDVPKFYVQCGPVRTILLADCHQHAAMSALDRSLQTHLWIYDDPQLSERDQQDHLMVEALLHLEPHAQVSEIGFDRDDAVPVGVPEIVTCWHQLMVGMRRMFVAAGLVGRSMASVAGVEGRPDSGRPRLPR